MRLSALGLCLALAFSVTAQEPKKNPFRNAFEKAKVETTAAKTKSESPRQGPKILRGAEVGVGRLIPDLVFTDLMGRSGQLSDFKNARLTVVAFTSTSCPISKKYASSLARIEKDYTAKGVAFLFVNPTATDKPDASTFSGRYVHDTDGKLTAALGATATTEVIVLDAARTVLYRGAIDDQYGLGYALDAPRTKYLIPALDEALAGKPPVIGATESPGCSLEPDTSKATTVPLTYHARIERIVQANCVECHRAGGAAPFALEKYEDVVAHKGMIKKVVDRGTMPPWFAAPTAKGKHSLYSNDRSLTDSDQKDLIAWLAGDLKKGDPADAPLPRKYDSGWLIGTPDKVFQLPRPIAVKAEGVMPYQNVAIDTDYAEDRWVQALEVQPTAREVVHHVLVFALPKGARIGGESMGFLAAYVPGNNTLVYPDGYAKKLPKGTTLRFQIHYTPNGKATTDQTRLGVIFAKEPPKHEVQVVGIANVMFQIPPGADNYKISAQLPVPFDARVLAVFPHAHLRGKAMQYELKTPGGKTDKLLEVPHYDFNWQLQYRFTDAVLAPRGSTLIYTAWYDNSDKNPANPDPGITVRWGQQTYEEMHLGYLEYVVEGGSGKLGGRPRGLLGQQPVTDVKLPKGGIVIPEQFKRVFMKFDKNNDGKLDQKEFDSLPPFLQNAVADYIRNLKP